MPDWQLLGVLETLIQKLELYDDSDRLKELRIDGLNRDLLLKDRNLADRFGRGALHVQKLFIGNVRLTRRETRDALALMVMTILSGPNTPSSLGLFNLGF